MLALQHEHWSSPTGCHEDCPACAENVTCECDNCGRLCPKEELNPIQDYAERVDPGGDEPDGECPECGALAYAVPPEPPFLFRPEKRTDPAGLSNGERAVRAAAALATYQGLDQPVEARFADLLCDLMHLADRERLDFSAPLQRAQHYHQTGR